MADKTVNFTINLNGNAYEGVVNLNDAFGNFNSAAEKTETLMKRLGDKALYFNNIIQTVQTVAGKVGNAIGSPSQ